jgi:hypothetical protein
MPSSTEPVSFVARSTGVVSLGNTVHGQAAAPDVVNDHAYGVVIATPDPLMAPLTLAV